MGDRKKEALTKFNKDNIVEAAKKLFELQGIDKTTMNDIAKEADYSKATIYAYFTSKDEIYNTIVCDYMILLRESLASAIQSYSDFHECYFAICNCIVVFEEKYPFYFNSLIGEIGFSKELIESNAVLAQIYQTGEEINKIILELISLGVKSKIIRPDIEQLPTVFFLWSSLSGIIQMASRKREYFEIRLGMDRSTYLRNCFDTLYRSLTLS
ncbi:MAG TPA: TetR/AcrR family transcriptional regulator [Lachnospiraceae bacterium]|nr:TetR/AcrR family transcriptional regulator [Lachnospiraceae bacterium]